MSGMASSRNCPKPAALGFVEFSQLRKSVRLVTTRNPNPWRNRLMVISIALISIIPFGFAWYLAKNPQLIRDRQTTNYGHLITPAKMVGYDLFLQSPVNGVENLAEIKGHWVMVQVVNRPVCDDPCKETLQRTEKVRALMSKDIPRVRRLLLFPGNADAQSAQEIATLYPNLLITGMSEALLQRLQEAVGGPLADGTVVLLDPLTNAMMWYAPGSDPLGILRDLQRLLRISQIG